ncbi:MAG TPA: asparagine synthase (glutamine-hydrolyzing) [Xanthobacteraceae bacterium]|nr:asparagine synthase (glutamine-hydrolyzing) [Xanthobacteraceae bacterium]
MCGIAGMVDWRAATPADALRSIAEAMIETVRHRGPDAGEVWVEAEGGVALGQRRLAIIDLSPGGAQPMHSADRRFVITFNGEIYNYRDIRRELQAAGHAMRSDSDTEVLLEACALWGVEAAIERAIGMFAFALWDRKTRSLILARDRLGIKPLYYAATPERVLFASQLKAFRPTPHWKPTIDADAVVGYLRHAYIAQPRTIYREAEKLAPGHILTLREGSMPSPKCFWDLRGIAIAGQRRNDPAPDAQEATDRLDGLLRDSVKLRMIADVPLGAFLSGGIDSSTVVALMQAQSRRPVKTFSIGFHEGEYDEAHCAKQVAAHLGTDHTEFYVEPRHALEVIPHLADWFDEPFADPSQIPTYLVSELTRKHVTVALSGDGGDELFAGYNRYVWAERLARAVNLVPRPLRGASATALRALAPQTWNRLFAFVPASWRPALPGDKLHKITTLLDNPQPDAIYRRLVSQWERPDEIAAAGQEPRGPLWDPSIAQDFPDLVPRMQFLDMISYLPDDILTKVDRATMAVGLEGRVPLLDHRVVAYSWSLPLEFKLRGGRSKWLLRQVLDRYVPRPLIDRPKMGFGVPIDAWLRGPLREWAESLLTPARLASDGFVRVEPVRQAWQEHLEGSRNWQYPLWTVLMLQAWRARWA